MSKIIKYLLLSLLIFACKKQSNPLGDHLPDATQNGAGTMGFTVDGKVYTAWAPYSQQFHYSGDIASQSYQYFDNAYHFVLGSNLYGRWKWSITVAVDSIELKEGMKISLGRLGHDKGFANWLDGDGKDYDAPIGGSEDSFLKITHVDRDNAQLSGTFQFDASDENSSKTIHVRDGRFDIIYYK